jgi:mannose-6-phosphate isomerase-like protein (cupin superfamily)
MRTDRTWGHYTVLHTDGNAVKLKELVVAPGRRLSMQKHEKRAELWFVAHGQATVYSLDDSSKPALVGVFGRHQHVWIPRESWHQLSNDSDQELRMIEIQYGVDCVEEDIVRMDLDGR